MSEPQDIAEAFDEETTGADPDAPPGDRVDLAPDDPYLVGEELSTEPILDSVASREARLEPDGDDVVASAIDDREVDLMEADLSEALIADEIDLVADDADLSAEEAAVHVVEPADDAT
jgi:hypothetical protein